MKRRILSFWVTLCMFMAIMPILPVRAYNTGTVNEYRAISTGDQNAAVIKSDNSLWIWGPNNHGQTGDSPSSWLYEMKDGKRKLLTDTTPIKFMDNVKDISIGGSHVMAITLDGSLYGWGSNSNGQIGDGTKEDKNQPVKIMENVSAVSAGHASTLAIKEDGSLWSWGWNNCGQIGIDGPRIDQLVPVKIMDDVKSISMGSTTAMAITNDNSLWSWGGDNWGERGDGTYGNQLKPVKIMDDVKHVSIGGVHTMIIKNDDSLWGCGYNKYGQLGTGDNKNARIPIKIMDNVKYVSSGYEHTMIIKEDSSLWACGENNLGQLGIGTTDNSNVPIKIMDNIREVSAGWDYTLAVTNANEVFSWGNNGYSQLGDGSVESKSFPIKIMDNVKHPSGNIEQSNQVSSSLSDWAENDINDAIALGLIPEELQSEWQMPITRVDFCKLAWKLYIKMIVECDAEIVEANIEFPDTIGLPGDDEAIISTIATLGIVSGYEDNTFRPYNEITREEAAVMLARTVSCFGKDSTNNYPIIFGDISDISDWAKNSVDLVSAIGIMSGVQVSDYILNFQPKGTYTREQAMVTFYRLYNLLTRIETLQEKFPDKRDLYTLDTVPKIKINGIDANFGNYHGMYIDNYSVLDKKDKSFDVSFDVYNTAYIYGIVEVYDKNDNWIDAVPIKKMSDNGTSIKGSLWDNSIDLINDIMNKNLLTYRQASGCSKKTSIKVNIPYGGYIKITNNAVESPLLAIMNITDIGFSTYKLVDTFTNYDNSTSEKYMDKLTKEALKNEYFVNLIKSVELKDKFNEELFKGITKDINISNESAGERISTVLQNIDNLNLTSLIIDSAESIGLSAAETTFENLAGPAGVAMKGLFFGTKAANTAIETKHYFDTVFSTDSIMIQNLGQGLTGTSMGGR